MRFATSSENMHLRELGIEDDCSQLHEHIESARAMKNDCVPALLRAVVEI